MDAVRYPESFAVLDHYDYSSEPNDRGELCALPEQFAPVHALFRPPPGRAVWNQRQWDEYGRRSPVFLDRWSSEHAACGKRIKVVLSLRFDDEDPDACPRCVAEAACRSESGPDVWWAEQERRQLDRYARQRERDEEKRDVEAWEERERHRRFIEESRRRPRLAE